MSPGKQSGPASRREFGVAEGGKGVEGDTGRAGLRGGGMPVKTQGIRPGVGFAEFSEPGEVFDPFWCRVFGLRESGVGDAVEAGEFGNKMGLRVEGGGVFGVDFWKQAEGGGGPVRRFRSGEHFASSGKMALNRGVPRF